MKENKGEHPFGDTGQIVLLAVFLALWTADSFFLRISTQASHALPLAARLAAASAFMAAGFVLFSYGHKVVHDGERGRRIVTDGAFKYVRHPLYLASMLFYIGLTISTASIASLALTAVIFLFYDYIARYEERLLTEKHGEAYAEYKRHAGRWLPIKRPERGEKAC